MSKEGLEKSTRTMSSGKPKDSSRLALFSMPSPTPELASPSRAALRNVMYQQL